MFKNAHGRTSSERHGEFNKYRSRINLLESEWIYSVLLVLAASQDGELRVECAEPCVRGLRADLSEQPSFSTTFSTTVSPLVQLFQLAAKEKSVPCLHNCVVPTKHADGLAPERE